MMENIHSETYSLQIDNIVKDPIEKDMLFNAVREFPSIAEKAQWAVNWIESNDSFATRLIAFAIMEGIFFSGSFCAIFWLKKRNVMPGLCASNELIARDEGLHCNFAVLLYSMLNNKLSESDIHSMINDAVQIETKFICESLPCSLLGMNSNSMTEYIKFVADRLLVQLGYSKFFEAKNPFDFMESISIEGKANFFETRPTQYQKSSVLNKTRDSTFNISDDF
jgi:ribonucleotide reductase beta subunit family protein with ferritin-like domain